MPKRKPVPCQECGMEPEVWRFLLTWNIRCRWLACWWRHGKITGWSWRAVVRDWNRVNGPEHILPEPKSSRFQVVSWGWRSLRIGYQVFPAGSSYRWYLWLGPLEIRRWDNGH